MAASIGINFGSISCCVAVHKDGKTVVVANDLGDRVTPAVVAFTEREKSVGLAAKQGKIRNASNTITNVKRLLAKRYEDPHVKSYVKKSSCKVIEKACFPVFDVEYQEKRLLINPREVTTLILKKMMDIAKVHGGSAAHDAVISVPLDFSPDQCKQLSNAAKEAGFTVLQLISEPTAAVLAYNIGQETPTDNSTVLVFRLGGTCLDISIISVNSGIYRVLANTTDTSLGGEQLTDQLVEYCAADFQRNWKCDMRENKRSMAKLHSACESCKHVLSTMNSSTVFVESLYDGLDLNCNVSRARLESLFSSILPACLQPLQKVLDDAGLDKADIDKVIVSGGSTRIPKLQKLVRDYFPDAELLNTIAPDEVVAMGAAVQAGLLCTVDEDDIEENGVVECCSKNIMIKILDDNRVEKLLTVIPVNTPIPVRRQHVLQVGKDQCSACIQIYEGVSVEDAKLLAKVVLHNLPVDSEDGKSVTTILHFRREGSLHVTCCEKTSGITQDVTIEVSES
ncbi:heat shock 70 kDa protein 14-like [Saccoglossus kowalevskii]|uniref:Heat shock 70 kDa protein 14 n=1 Tax=Saccoglossus kowalevskii TaxID=10224 RepID=A0ABM0GPU0_SACKO|nr:PREDICTED: heat shock 70 kDa protein 14-like [Saccoglossus kowalevskii]